MVACGFIATVLGARLLANAFVAYVNGRFHP